MTKYYKLIIQISGDEQQENAIAVLNYNSNFESVEQQAESIIVSYKSENQSRTELEATMNDLNLCVDWKIEDEPEINWNETFEKSFQPISLSDNSWSVRASFHEPRSTNYEIIINPKMSFGTGHHETTSQMMEFLSKESFQNKKVWDYGTGTGILAIMAEKLGAAEVKANDNEDWAYFNSLENAELNHCQHIKFCLGDIPLCEKADFLQPKADYFDIIIANITKNILLDSAFKIDEYSKPNTILYLSGFYEEDIVEIEKKYKSFNFHLINQSNLNAWACLKLIKN